MIIAMPAMNMVQTAIDQPVQVIAMRHGFVPAAGAVDMGTGQPGRAAIGIGGGNGHDMFIDMIAVRVMQVAIVQIIDMAIVADGGVATAGAMDMGVIGMNGAGHRAHLSSGRHLNGWPATGAPPEPGSCPIRPRPASDEAESCRA
jgi:hypothetical protein